MIDAEPPPHPPADVDPALLDRLAALEAEGGEIWRRFDREVRRKEFHPFVPADYARMLQLLLALRAPGLRFLEWGSATGVITIMADLLGFEAYGIELDPELVEIARGLAERFGSGARFAAGSFIPAGYQWKPRTGDARTGTIGQGVSGYAQLGLALHDFDLVYAYPWDGEDPMMHDLLRARGRPGARLVLAGGAEGVRVYRGAVREL
ncbi:MAG TPA: hypothetical protein VM890_14350 [Longimicrobium sp.]|nr:hypothetical protein [Longimicrobium sp.]